MKNILGYLALISLCLSCNQQVQDPAKVTAKTNQIDSVSVQDSSIINSYLPYKTRMVDEINKVLSYAPISLTKDDGKMQSSLGNLMADLIYEKASDWFEKESGKNLDFVMSNHGGIRAAIFKGPVKVEQAFQLMPFDNTIVVTELSKEKVVELFDYFVRQKKAHPLSDEVQIKIGKEGSYQVLIQGKPLEERTYFVATSNYLQKGGDNMDFFANPIHLYDTNYLIRDAITAYFATKDSLVARLDDRVQILNN